MTQLIATDDGQEPLATQPGGVADPTEHRADGQGDAREADPLDHRARLVRRLGADGRVVARDHRSIRGRLGVGRVLAHGVVPFR